MYRYFTLLFILPFFCPALSAQSLSEKIDLLDNYIEQARKQWDVPGLAVTIVKDGRSLLLKGYGERQLGSGRTVDGKTLFAICSTTKAMTAAAMAMLVDEGKVGWDDPVIDYLPDFQLSDPYVTRAVRIRDLFTHNTGLGSADFLWYVWQYEPKQIIRKMADLDLSYPLRGGYTYQNIMYAVSGAIISQVSEQSWASFLQERIINPLGMAYTFPTWQQSRDHKNRSIAHHWIDGEITPIPDANADPIAPAGAVWSCAEDVQKWMLFVLDSARVDGRRLISKKNYEEWLKPQTLISDDGFYPTQKLTRPHWKTYALGWFQHDYYGRAVSFHTGSLQGTVAIIGLIPDEKLGVYVFGNLDHAEVRHAIMYKVFDILGPDDPNRDWSTDLKELYDRRKIDRQAQSNGEKEKIDRPFPEEAFPGTYRNDFLGELTVYEKEGDLYAQIGAFKSLLRHESHLRFKVKYIDQPWRDNGWLQFTDDGHKVTGLEIYGRSFEKELL